MERLLKFASLCNLRIAETDNRLLDNSCYVDFFDHIGYKEGARDFLENLIKEECLIVIRNPQHDTFKEALEDRLRRGKRYIFSSLSNEEQKWVWRSKRNIEDFFVKFPRYSKWIEFLDEHPIKKFEYQFEQEDFPNLVKARYQMLENNLNYNVINIIRPYLEKNEIFSRSDIYNHINKMEMFSHNFCEAIKRIIIDDPYQLNLCEQNKLNPLIQEYYPERLPQILKNPNQFLEEKKSEYEIIEKDITTITTKINFNATLNFNDIIDIRDDTRTTLKKKEESNPQNYERNFFDYKNALLDALIQCYERKGYSSSIYKKNKIVPLTVAGLTGLAMHEMGQYQADIIRSIIGEGFWGRVVEGAIIITTPIVSSYMGDKFSIKKREEWINFEQLLGKTIDSAATNSIQENER